MKTTQEKIEIMMASESGKQIQMLYDYGAIGGKEWINCIPVWNWDQTDYRVKPGEILEKKEVKCEIYQEGGFYLFNPPGALGFDLHCAIDFMGFKAFEFEDGTRSCVSPICFIAFGGQHYNFVFLTWPKNEMINAKTEVAKYVVFEVPSP